MGTGDAKLRDASKRYASFCLRLNGDGLLSGALAGEGDVPTVVSSVGDDEGVAGLCRLQRGGEF